MVRITRTEHELGVEVHDDGIGFDPAAAEGDGGLAGLADRIAALGGAFAVKSSPGPARGCARRSRRESAPLPDAPLRVAIAEDHYLVREGVRALLEDSGEVEVVAAVGTAIELLRAVAELAPDAVLTDIRMPPGHHMEGIEAAHRIRSEHPGVGVVVLSQHPDEAYAFALLEDGTGGLAHLLKDRIGDLDELLRALREVCAGRSALDPRVVDGLVERRSRRARSGLDDLTPRELDVLREMARGKTNRAIAETMFLSESAVEKHISAIFGKLGQPREPHVHRRVAAVLAFLQESR